MNRETFQTWAAERPRLLDGATGTNLRLAGMPVGVCSEAWILDHPEPLQDLQRAYVAAGSELVIAPTFGANRVLLAHHGLEQHVAPLNRALVAISREAVGETALVAGDLTTTGQPVPSGDDAAYKSLLSVYTEQAEAQLEAGVDLFLIETLMGLTESMAALEAVRALCDLPILCSFSVQTDGQCYFGGNLFEAAEILPELGADAIGVNCSNGPDLLVSAVSGVRAACALPVLAKPNAGLPTMTEDGRAVYSMGPEDFARHMRRLVDSGATLVGGCCGTTPAHIRALHSALSPADKA